MSGNLSRIFQGAGADEELSALRQRMIQMRLANCAEYMEPVARAKLEMMVSEDMTSLAVAKYFGVSRNIIVSNVSWGWGLRHEANMLVLHKSGYCDEVEIMVTAADICGDKIKRHGHWDYPRIRNVWYAVPPELADNPDIPARAGILAVSFGVWDVREDRSWILREPLDGEKCVSYVRVVRKPALRPKSKRVMKVSERDRLRLMRLGALRAWGNLERILLLK